MNKLKISAEQYIVKIHSEEEIDHEKYGKMVKVSARIDCYGGKSEIKDRWFGKEEWEKVKEQDFYVGFLLGIIMEKYKSILDKDIKIETQIINGVDVGLMRYVRITHIPTGIQVIENDRRGLIRAYNVAIKKLEEQVENTIEGPRV